MRCYLLAIFMFVIVAFYFPLRGVLLMFVVNLVCDAELFKLLLLYKNFSLTSNLSVILVI